VDSVILEIIFKLITKKSMLALEQGEVAGDLTVGRDGK
jgi:hypothetical protein